MAVTINASTSAGLISTADTSGVLQLQTANTTAVTVNANQTVSLAVGTANGVTYLNGSKVLTSGSALTFDGTNLGIGNSLSGIGGYVVVNAGGTGSSGLFRVNYNGTNVGQFYTDSSSNLYVENVVAGKPVIFSTTAGEGMRLNSTGLGIGTSSPKEKFDSRGAGVFTGDNATGTNAFGTAEGLLLSTTTGVARITAVSNGNNNVNLVLRSLNAGSASSTMMLDYAGNLGLGATSITPRDSGARTLELYGTSSGRTAIKFTNSTSGTGATDGMFLGYDDNLNFSIVNNESGVITLGTSNTERARITSSGYAKFSNDGVYTNSTSVQHEFNQAANDDCLVVNATNASFSNRALIIRATRDTSGSNYYYLGCYNNTASSFKMFIADSGNLTNTNGSYGTISDAKMKTDIVDAGSQWADVKAIRFRKFKMKDDPEQRVQLGVIAQEIEQTSAGLVEEHKDTDADNNDLGTTTKSVKTSILLMKAAVALQEAMTRIEQLEARLDAANL